MTTNPRTVWDTVALLTLFDTVNSVGRVDGNLKIQKLTFLAELAAEEHDLRVAHFRFFRYTYGPYSGALTERVSQLENADVLTRGRVLTKRGRYILDYAKDAIERSSEASEAQAILHEVALKFGRRTGTHLKDYVYGVRIAVPDLDGEQRRIRDVPLGLDLIDPATDPHLKEIQPFDEDTLDEISAELAMSPAILRPDSQSYRRTVADAMKRAATACSKKPLATFS